MSSPVKKISTDGYEMRMEEDPDIKIEDCRCPKCGENIYKSNNVRMRTDCTLENKYYCINCNWEGWA